jgi:hypothetical protein
MAAADFPRSSSASRLWIKIIVEPCLGVVATLARPATNNTGSFTGSAVCFAAHGD